MTSTALPSCGTKQSRACLGREHESSASASASPEKKRKLSSPSAADVATVVGPVMDRAASFEFRAFCDHFLLPDIVMDDGVTTQQETLPLLLGSFMVSIKWPSIGVKRQFLGDVRSRICHIMWVWLTAERRMVEGLPPWSFEELSAGTETKLVPTADCDSSLKLAQETLSATPVVPSHAFSNSFSFERSCLEHVVHLLAVDHRLPSQELFGCIGDRKDGITIARIKSLLDRTGLSSDKWLLRSIYKAFKAAVNADNKTDMRAWTRIHLVLLHMLVAMEKHSVVDETLTSSSLANAFGAFMHSDAADRKDLFGPLHAKEENVDRFIEAQFEQQPRIKRIFDHAVDLERRVPADQIRRLLPGDDGLSFYVPAASLEEIMLYCTEAHNCRTDAGLVAMHLLAAHHGRKATIAPIVASVLQARCAHDEHERKARDAAEYADPALRSFRTWSEIIAAADKAMRLSSPTSSSEVAVQFALAVPAGKALSMIMHELRRLDDDRKRRLSEMRAYEAKTLTLISSQASSTSRPDKAAEVRGLMRHTVSCDFEQDPETADLVKVVQQQLDNLILGDPKVFTSESGFELKETSAPDDATPRFVAGLTVRLQAYAQIASAVRGLAKKKAKARARSYSLADSDPRAQALSNALVLRLLAQAIIDLFPAGVKIESKVAAADGAEHKADRTQQFVAPVIDGDKYNQRLAYVFGLSNTSHVAPYWSLYDVAFASLTANM